MSKDIKLDEYWKHENEEQEKQKQKAYETKGFHTFWTAPVGESKISIPPQIPRVRDSFGKTRKVFSVLVGDSSQEFDWTIVPFGDLYRYITRHFSKTPNELLTFTLVRTGVGQDTRYSVKEES